MLKLVLELQCIIVKHLSLLRFFHFGHLRIHCISRLLRRSIDGDVRQLLLVGLAGRRVLTVHLEGSLHPLLLVRVGTGCDYILLPAGYACLDVVALRQRLPITEVIQLHGVTLGPKENAHVMLPVFVAATTGDTRLREIHYLERVHLVLDPAFRTEIKPLLVAACVRVDLHEEIISVFIKCIPLCL